MLLEWRVSRELIPYLDACQFMEERVAAIAEGCAPELIWLLEHPSLYTIGTSGNTEEILRNPNCLPVHATGRGGRVTYHGPGQRIGYVLLDLKKRNLNPRAFVHSLEVWLIRVLDALGVRGFVDPQRVGVWVRGFPGAPAEERKIAAIGVRIRRGISFHGFALNQAPDLTPFNDVIPCGLSDFRMTSLAELRCHVSLSNIDALLRESCLWVEQRNMLDMHAKNIMEPKKL